MAAFSHVVTAVDFSPATDSQLQYLSQLQQLGLNTVTLMHVLDARYGRAPAEEHQAMYEELLNDHAETLRDQGLTVHTELRTGDPAPAIVTYAREQDADLILLASRGHNMLKRLLIGSTAAEVLNTTSTPVLLDQVAPNDVEGAAARTAARANGFSRILLATDFSPSADNAEKMAIALSEQAEAAVFMTVRNDKKNLTTIELAERKLNRLADQASKAVKTHVVQGDSPADAISEVADREKSTLLIVGKRGRGNIEGRIVGSTASSLAKYANRPVLMVPSAKAVRDADARAEAKEAV